jgi:signal transduction histidine kinase
MAWYRNSSIRTKVKLSLTVAYVAVLLSFAVFAWNDVRMMNEHLVKQTSALAVMLGANSLTALLFQDPDVAGDVLSSVQLEPSIEFACTYDMTGRVFARYGEANGPVPPLTLPIAREGIVLNGDGRIDVIKPIWHNKLQTGALMLRIDTSALNQQLWQYAWVFAAILAFAAAVTLITASQLHRVISRPIIRMADVMRRVSTNNDYTCRVEKEAEDELGVLSDGFNEMLTQIERRQAEIRDLNKQLIKTSRTAGQAQVATSVLHNVGNVLNSVNVSASLMKENVQGSHVEGLVSAVALLNEHEHDLAGFFASDERGRRLHGYLALLADTLTKENQSCADCVDALLSNVDQIKRIVQAQQSFANLGQLIETCQLNEIMEDALQIVAISFQRHNIQIVREFEDVPPVDIDKAKLLHVLVNLIGNAKDALKDSDKPEKILTLCIALRGEDRVRLEVVDNAIGIEPDKLVEIFTYGFTTKKDGHGFGLHSAANEVSSMGGSLTALSDGIGTGATFTIELELQQEAVAI